jgi:dCMP deaminase
MLEDGRPDMHEYYMGIAMAVRKRANCLGSRVGAVAVVGNRIVSTGYNGTPSKMTNCLDGGCHRCANRDKYPSGAAYDLCICVHAEQNAMLAAARFGIALQGGAVYSTLQPCFGCMKEMLQAGVVDVFYLHPWKHPDPEPEKQAQYLRLQNHFAHFEPVLLEDPDFAWATSRLNARV